jgi:hypothetical protein
LLWLEGLCPKIAVLGCSRLSLPTNMCNSITKFGVYILNTERPVDKLVFLVLIGIYGGKLYNAAVLWQERPNNSFISTLHSPLLFQSRNKCEVSRPAQVKLSTIN